jgi:hypothetical protein
VKNVVLLMLDNHSPDTLFAWLPRGDEGRGFLDGGLNQLFGDQDVRSRANQLGSLALR